MLPKLRSLYKCKRKILNVGDSLLVYPTLPCGIKVNKRDKRQFGENQSKIRFFFPELFFIFCIWSEDLYFLLQCTWKWWISSWEIWGAGSLTLAFFRKNNVYFNEFTLISGWNTKKLGEPNLLTCTNFWHLEAFNEVRDNELTYWLAFNLLMFSWTRLCNMFCCKHQ